MLKNSTRLWVIALLLGWLFDFLFWEKRPGVNFAIFALLCLAGGLVLLLPSGIRPQLRTLLLLAPFLFFAVISFLRREPLSAFLAYTFTLFSLSLFVITYLGGRWVQYSLSDYIARYFDLFLRMFERPAAFNREVRKLQVEAGVVHRHTPVWAILRGLLIALPVLAVFASLLASADVVFDQQLQRFVELFRLENLPEYIFRLMYILAGAYLIAGAILYAATRSSDEKLIGEAKPVISPFLGFTEASIVLGSLSLLFLAFVAVQFQYFFGGHANIQIDGFTYSEYARRGFGELVTVAFFTLFLLLGLGGITKREGETQRRVFSGLGIGLVAMVLVMLVSAYQRLSLYETAYGFSRLRTYTHVVLYWIAFLLVVTIVLEMLRRERMFAFFAVLAAFGFALSLSLLNVDGFIVKQNIARELGGHTETEPAELPGDRRGGGDRLDSNYFLTLSDDAIPTMVDSYRSGTLPDGMQNKIGAALACIRHRRIQLDEEPYWQSFHLSTYRADLSLALVDRSLDEYEIVGEHWSYAALDAEGTEFPCTPYYSD